MKEDRDEMQMTTLQNKMDKLKSKILGPQVPLLVSNVFHFCSGFAF